MSSLKVAILGCGPAGIFAAHAAAEAHAHFNIFSKPRKSYMRGAQYLHRPIPGLSGDPFQVEYSLKGTTKGYRNKVYGDTSDVLVSPETLVGTADAWDIREAYDAGWDRYHRRVLDADISKWTEDDLFALTSKYDLVVSTIPANLLCRHEHDFSYQSVQVTDFIKTQGPFEGRDNLVVCSGDSDDWWYRQSRIHGWENTEYPEGVDLSNLREMAHVFDVEKPISNNCDCFKGIAREGRYGRWQKGVLSHEAYYNTAHTLRGVATGWMNS